MGKGDYPTKRGDRIAAEQRVKAKAVRIIKGWFRRPSEGKLESDPKFVGKIAHTPHPCSGACCGNPRRHHKGKDKLTLQEVKELERERDEG